MPNLEKKSFAKLKAHFGSLCKSVLVTASELRPVKVLLGGGYRTNDGRRHSESLHPVLKSTAVALHPRAVPVVAQVRLQRVLERCRGWWAFSLVRGCAIRSPVLPTLRPWPCPLRPDLRHGYPP